MKFSRQMWGFIWLFYQFKHTTKRFVSCLRFERGYNIPSILIQLEYIRIHNGKELRFISLDKYKVGNKLGYYLITQSLTKLKKKKKKKNIWDKKVNLYLNEPVIQFFDMIFDIVQIVIILYIFKTI